MNLNDERHLNRITIGELGAATKMIAFEEKDFKKELAPSNSQICLFERKGKKFVMMTYRL